jgi:hypothetical protein
MNTDEYLKLIEELPDLTAHGYGVQRDPYLGSTYKETFKNMREELRDSYDAFNACCDWIDANRTFEPGWSSYTLKHEVENWLRREGKYRYIPQGAFILAALHKGIRMRPIPNDLGVFVG